MPNWHPVVVAAELLLAVLVLGLVPLLLEQAALSNARAAANATDVVSLPIFLTNLPFLGVSAVQGSLCWS